ncbi:MAG: hypothetical protein J5I98_26605 [Phaeodactylibacter sp.]|nr:hypothetical protein [Phaeodactylibacter sp.]
MKNPIYVFGLLALAVLFFGCEKEEAAPMVDENGLTPDINALISEDNLNALLGLGLAVNGGATPPDLNNEYVISTCVITASSAGDIPGTRTQDFFIRLYDQADLEITVDYRHGTQVGEAIGSYIVGEDCAFSVFIEVNEIHTPTSSEARLVLVVSGKLANNGIEDIQVANLMLDNFGNANNLWIPNGTGRLFEDQDNFSEVVGGGSEWYAKLPDCPCEYSESLDGKAEMCGEWEDFSNGCNGFFNYLDKYHYGATYEIRWAKDEDSPGQQCTYDRNRRLITEGLAAGTPDKYGVVDPCNPNSDHASADVAPWEGSMPCYQYLEEWRSSEGKNCQKNAVNGISHLRVMLGNMNCERATAIFRMVDDSQSAAQELRDYLKGRLNYTPANLKSYLQQVYNEYDCDDNLDETNCSALKEAIQNL